MATDVDTALSSSRAPLGPYTMSLTFGGTDPLLGVTPRNPKFTFGHPEIFCRA